MPGFRTLAAQLRASLAALEVGCYSGHDCATAAEELAATRNACAAAEARLAARAAKCGVHRERGFADASDWLASTTGSTAREARAALDTMGAVEACPNTRDALVAGTVSMAQAREIARTESVVPGCESELLALAQRGSLGAVRDRARARRLAAIDPEKLYARQRAAREFVHWIDELGMIRCRGAFTPEVGIPFVNRLDAETDRVRKAARRKGAVEGREAYAADAFARIVEGGGSGTATSADIVITIDWTAFVRGHLHPGERSQIVGGGPIPPSLVRTLSKHAFLKAVLHDGVEIQQVLHVGRYRKVELRTALELGPGPEFAGLTCSEAGCDRRYGLQFDHVHPVAANGVTSKANLQPICTPHHHEKTERDRQAGLLGRRRAGRGPP